MKILSWNVNGLRAVHKKGFLEPIFSNAPDIVCLQEVKAEPEQLPAEVRERPGYRAYFTHPEEKKGYSGVALYSKIEPKEVVYGMNAHFPDTEGRMITAMYDHFALVGVYIPNGGGAPERFEYKLDYLDAFLEYVNGLRAQGMPVIFTGDINIAHEEIDLARPKNNQDNPGFRIEVREWLDEVVRQGWVDTFRHFYPDKRDAYSYWDMQTFARERNVGWRIDYVFVSPDLLPKLKKAFILSDRYGSDHCPVGVEMSL